MKVTVIMPTYNASRQLAEAVESVLAQTYSNFEFIAVNDGSTDNTGEILRKYASLDSRLRVIEQDNQGIAISLNKALREASTEWAMVMHADDIMLPNRLERQIQFIQENPDLRITSCKAHYISDLGKQLGQTSADLFTREKFNWYLENNEAIGILHPGVALHVQTILKLGGYRQAYWPAEDIDLWNRAAEKNCLILVQNEILMKYRIHNGSASTSKFGLTRLRYEWARACMFARRNNLPEPTWEVFQDQLKKAPLFFKINNQRKTNAKAYYHAAGHDFLQGYYGSGMVKLGLAALLQPMYVFPRLGEQFFRQS